MAENKLSWTELRRALATRAGVSEKEAYLFLNAFQSQLMEALKQDKQVKINGLGTFKLQAVAPRKSVNVSTGEQITIEGYNKIAFVPEAGVKELVEKPAAEGLQPAAAVDPIQKLGAQAEEIVDILGELGQSPDQKPKPVKEPEPEPEKAPEPEPEKAPEPEPAKTPEPVKAPTPEKPKKKYHFLRDTLICVVILLFLLLGGFFFLRHQLSSWINGLVNGTPEQTEVVAEPEEAPAQPSIDFDLKETIEDWYYSAKRWVLGYFEVSEAEVIELADEEDIIAAEVEIEEPEVIEEVAEEEEPVEETTSAPGQYNEWIATEQIAYGSRLAWIAKKHYGNKIYWPYLYDANRDRIVNPSQIPIGTLIRVPKLTPAQLDTTNAYFQQLREEAYSKTR